MSFVRSQFISIDGSIITGKGVNVAPTWVTVAGLLTVVGETNSLRLRLEAVDFSDPITYTLVSGSLPRGVFLGNDGVIEGSAPVVTVDTFRSSTLHDACPRAILVGPCCCRGRLHTVGPCAAPAGMAQWC